VSENDNCNCAGTIKVAIKSHGKECLKRKALRQPRKTDIEGVDVMCWGRLFQVRTAATEKARSKAMQQWVTRERLNVRRFKMSYTWQTRLKCFKTSHTWQTRLKCFKTSHTWQTRLKRFKMSQTWQTRLKYLLMVTDDKVMASSVAESGASCNNSELSLPAHRIKSLTCKVSN